MIRDFDTPSHRAFTLAKSIAWTVIVRLSNRKIILDTAEREMLAKTLAEGIEQEARFIVEYEKQVEPASGENDT